MVLFFIFVIYIKRALSGQICCLKRSNVILRSQINGFPPSQYLTHALSPASQFDTHRAIRLYFVQTGIFFPQKLSKRTWVFLALGLTKFWKVFSQNESIKTREFWLKMIPVLTDYSVSKGFLFTFCFCKRRFLCDKVPRI